MFVRIGLVFGIFFFYFGKSILGSRCFVDWVSVREIFREDLSCILE